MSLFFYRIFYSSPLYWNYIFYVSYWPRDLAQMVKNLPKIQETQVWFLGLEDLLDIYRLQYSCQGDPIDRGAWQAKAMGSKELEMTEQLNMFPIILWGYWRISSVQSLHRVWLFAIPWTAARQASLSITNSWTFSNSSPLS